MGGVEFQSWINKVQLATDYATLRKQAGAMKLMIRAIEEQLAFYSGKDYACSEGHLKYLEECLESEIEMNNILTVENLELQRQIEDTSGRWGVLE